LRGDLLAEDRGGARRVPQCERGAGVGEDAVVDAVGVLVRARDVVDRVAAVGVRVYATGPELRVALEQRPVVPQPGGVAGGEVVLPDGKCDVALQVDLREAVRWVPAVAFLEVARPGPVPGIEQALEAVLERVRPGARQRLAPILDDRLGYVGMEGEKAGIHPRLRIPEDEPGVVVAAQASGGDAVVVAGANARP
jgi:hypothetical protein